MTAKAVINDWLAALQAGDFDRMNSFYAEDCEMYFPGDPAIVPWAGHKKGKAAIIDCFITVAETLDIRSHEFLDIIAEGENVVVIGFEVSANRKTGYEFNQYYAWHFRVRDGQIIYYRLFEDTEAIARAYAS